MKDVNVPTADTILTAALAMMAGTAFLTAVGCMGYVLGWGDDPTVVVHIGGLGLAFYALSAGISFLLSGAFFAPVAIWLAYKKY